jgi:hypothetical protein
LVRSGRDHGHFLSKEGNHGYRVSKEWSRGKQRRNGAGPALGLGGGDTGTTNPFGITTLILIFK